MTIQNSTATSSPVSSPKASPASPSSTSKSASTTTWSWKNVQLDITPYNNVENDAFYVNKSIKYKTKLGSCKQNIVSDFLIDMKKLKELTLL